MSQYEELDKRIITAIEKRKNPLHENACWTEADRIATAMGRESFRVIDGRLQALRKGGRIRHLTKVEANGVGGWHVVPNVGLGAMTHFFCEVCQKIQPTFFEGANHADVSGNFIGGDVVCCACSFIIATAYVPNVK